MLGGALGRMGAAGLLGTAAGGGGTTVPAGFSAIKADGWRGTQSSPPTYAPNTSPVLLPLTRTGWDATSAATGTPGSPGTCTPLTNITENAVITSRVRMPYIDAVTVPPLTATDVSLSTIIYSTDTISGVTNNSTKTSPKPVAQWTVPGRDTVGNSLPLELAAEHYDGVAAVRFRATDGTTTVSQVVSTTTLSGRAGDQQPLEVWAATLDITALAAGLITYNAEVFPRIGGTASILNSSDQSAAREFSPRYCRKGTKYYAYVVASGGNDTTGVWSSSPATAAATPFATMRSCQGTVNNVTRGVPLQAVDGCEMRLGAGTWVAQGTTSARAQFISAFIVTRDPAVAKASVILSFGAGQYPPFIGSSGAFTSPLTSAALIVRDLTISRTGINRITGQAGVPLDVWVDNCDYNDPSYGAALVGTGTLAVTGLNCTSQVISLGSGSTEYRLLRGIIGDVNGGLIEQWATFACKITRTGGPDSNQTSSGGMVVSNLWLKSSNLYVGLGDSVTSNINGFVCWKNVIEGIANTSGFRLMRMSSDNPQTANLTNVLIGYNTHVGDYSQGRDNLYYDEDPTHQRFHSQCLYIGNLVTQLNTKGDFFAPGEPGYDGLPRVGNWEFLYGVGCAGNMTMYADAQGNGTWLGAASNYRVFGQQFAGLGSKIGNGKCFADRVDPLFSNYQAVYDTLPTGSTLSSGSITGAGGGAYDIASGSPAKGLVAKSRRKFDFAGNAAPTTYDCAGAYA